MSISIDRLVRPPEDGDEWDIPILIRGLAKVGKELHTVENGKIETTFVGLLIAVVGGKSAGDERRKIVERAMRGKRAKANQKWVGTGRAPYGYTKIGKGKEARLEINQHEAQQVRRMFDLYLGLNGNQAIGLRSITAVFNTEGVPVTGRLRDEKNRPLANRIWRESTISKMMANRAYSGEFTWSGEVVSIPALAIIPREVFDAAQAQRAINRTECKRNAKFDYLLRGRVSCTCGRKMVSCKHFLDEKMYFYYECNRKRYEPSPDCDRKKIRGELADCVAWNWLVDVFRNPEKLLAGLREYAARQRDKAKPQRARLAELPGLIAECEAQARRLSKSLERVPEDDELSAKTLEDSLRQISAAHKHYTAECDKITTELATVEVGEADIQQVLGWAAEIRTAIEDDEISFNAKRLIIERLKVIAKIEYQNGERGLRLDCPVLAFASQWKKLDQVCEHFFTNEYSP